MGVQIDCHIPNFLSSVSKYVLKIIEGHLDISFKVVEESRETILFKRDQFTLEFPFYFINEERDKFLEEREHFDYSIKQFHLNKDNALWICPSGYKASGSVKYEIDIFGTIFVLLSRYEELVLSSDNFDAFNRFKAESAINLECLSRPIVDELVSLLKTLLEKELEITLDLDEGEYDILPSHDVDRPFKYLYYSNYYLLKRLGGDLMFRKSLGLARKRFKTFKKVQKGNLEADPYNTFDWIMEQSEKYGRKSTFHFIAEVTQPEFDHDYDLGDAEIKALLLSINSRGHNIALHPSFRSSRIEGQEKREFEKLKKACSKLDITQPIVKSRYHYLRWNNRSVDELEKAGLLVEQSLTFPQKAGFRCGTSKAYPAFNFQTMKASRLIIEPLIIMEVTLFSDAYMGMGNNLADAWNYVDDLKSHCKKHRGNFTVLWHNNELTTPEMKEFYSQCIR